MTDKTPKNTAETGIYKETATCVVPWGDDRALALMEDFKKLAATRNIEVTIKRGDCKPSRTPGIH